MMKGLVTEQHIDAGVRQLQGCAIAADQLDVNASGLRFLAAHFQAVGVCIDADQFRRGKNLAQVLE